MDHQLQNEQALSPEQALERVYHALLEKGYKGEEIGCMPLVTSEDAPVKKITLWEKWFGT